MGKTREEMCSFVHYRLTEIRNTDGWTDGWTNRQTDRWFAGKSLPKHGVSQLNRGFECKRSIILSLSSSSFMTDATITIKQTQTLPQHLGTRLWQICAPRRLRMISYGKENKVGYMATLVACGWAGAMLEKVTRLSGQEPYAQKAQKRWTSKKGTN